MASTLPVQGAWLHRRFISWFQDKEGEKVLFVPAISQVILIPNNRPKWPIWGWHILFPFIHILYSFPILYIFEGVNYFLNYPFCPPSTYGSLSSVPLTYLSYWHPLIISLQVPHACHSLSLDYYFCFLSLGFLRCYSSLTSLTSGRCSCCVLLYCFHQGTCYTSL